MVVVLFKLTNDDETYEAEVVWTEPGWVKIKQEVDNPKTMAIPSHLVQWVEWDGEEDRESDGEPRSTYTG